MKTNYGKMKCFICKKIMNKNSSAHKYCNKCKIKTNKLNIVIATRTSKLKYDEFKNYWNSLSNKYQLEIMINLSKKILEEKI